MEAETASLPTPQRDALNTPYWENLERGILSFQCCNSCGHLWLPARSECPNCLGDDWRWQPSIGRATLISWVVYHMAYHPAFAKRLPYTVAVVELDEGPRLMSNVLQIDGSCELKIGQRLGLRIEDESGTAVPRFVLV